MIDWKFKTRGVCPIGLDIGHSSVKMIQLAVSGGYRSVVAAAKADIDPALNGDKEAKRIFVVSAVKRMLANGGFRGRKVVSCLPNDSLRISSLRLGQTGTGKIEQAVKKEMQPRFGLDPDKDVVDYIVAGDVRHGDEIRSELILLAADSETVKDHIDMLTEAGLRPVAVDTIPCALFRGFERSLQRQEDKKQTTVFVDVGSRSTTVVFGRAGEISFIKQVPIGSERFNQEVAAKLGVDTSGAQTLRRALRAERLAVVSSWGLTCDKTDGDNQAQQEQDGAPALALPQTWAEDSFGVDSEKPCDFLQKQEQGFDGTRQRLDTSTRQAVVDAISAVAEELAKEISLCFRYCTVTFRGKRVERAVFAGGGAYEDILLNVLRRQLTVEIEVAQPLKGFDLMNVDFRGDRRGLLCEWAVAVGLSLKGLAPDRIAEDEPV
jgi:type IV pilus assembly protein PilM